MALPLYRCSHPKLAPNGNAGLWYDKFCDRWEGDWRKGLGDGGKLAWIRTVLNGEIGDRALLQETVERRNALILATGGKALIFRTKGPFVTGLGRSHPVENGFAWNHSLGTPYLPGSSMKGMVRSWATTWGQWPSEEAKVDTVNRIFGPPSEKSNSVGSVIFLDALPTKPMRLKAEVMTPHYGPYYQGNKPPADWYSPIPIPFLTVDSSQEFLFSLIPRRPDHKLDEVDCTRVEEWLVQALKYIGAGAKTATGYGRFEQFVPSYPKTAGVDWLESHARSRDITVDDLAKSTRVLAESWVSIDDLKLKNEVFSEIKELYQRLKWWDDAPSKGARRIISEYYKAWESGNK